MLVQIFFVCISRQNHSFCKILKHYTFENFLSSIFCIIDLHNIILFFMSIYLFSYIAFPFLCFILYNFFREIFWLMVNCVQARLVNFIIYVNSWGCNWKCFPLQRIEFGSPRFLGYYQPKSILSSIEVFIQTLEYQILLKQTWNKAKAWYLKPAFPSK